MTTPTNRPQVAVLQVHAIASGRVQGVGFRYTVCRHAERLHVVGTVQNREDGSVEIYAQGPRPELEAFLSALRTHAGLARVQHLTISWQSPSQPFENFSII